MFIKPKINCIKYPTHKIVKNVAVNKTNYKTTSLDSRAARRSCKSIINYELKH